MVVLHICPLSDDLSNGVHIAVPQHVKAQRKYVDAALWNLGQPLKIDGLEQVFTAASLEQLPPPYCRPDLAVFHELYIPRYLSLAKQLRRQNIPYIIVPHGALKKNAQKKSRLKKTAANLLLFKRFCNQAAGIQCLTEQEKAQSVMGKRIFIAPNGINPPPQTGLNASGVWRPKGLFGAAWLHTGYLRSCRRPRRFLSSRNGASDCAKRR